jgi:hypothetical protein
VVDDALNGRAAQRALVVQAVPVHGRNLCAFLCRARMRDFAPGQVPSLQDDNHPQDRPARSRRRRPRRTVRVSADGSVTPPEQVGRL